MNSFSLNQSIQQLGSNMSMSNNSKYIQPYTDPVNFLIQNKSQELSIHGANQLHKRLNSKTLKQQRLESQSDVTEQFLKREDRELKECTFHPELVTAKTEKRLGTSVSTVLVRKERSRSQIQFLNDQNKCLRELHEKIQFQREDDIRSHREAQR